MAPRGKLYLVGTPIGNLADLSRRAEEVLRDVACIGAEDTRRTKILLDHIGCRTPMFSFFARNERRRIPEILGRLEAGESVAVVSDAGNPGISDPAEKLVREGRMKEAIADFERLRREYAGTWIDRRARERLRALQAGAGE